MLKYNIVGLKVNIEKTMYTFMSRHQNEIQNYTDTYLTNPLKMWQTKILLMRKLKAY
jgi:hypothetical protein